MLWDKDECLRVGRMICTRKCIKMPGVTDNNSKETYICAFLGMNIENRPSLPIAYISFVSFSSVLFFFLLSFRRYILQYRFYIINYKQGIKNLWILTLCWMFILSNGPWVYSKVLLFKVYRFPCILILYNTDYTYKI